jgi:mannose-6-phosphate isomerase-like protein (cupin superfamily)
MRTGMSDSRSASRASFEDLTEENSDFRHVLYTGKTMQLVLMALEPGEEIGEEIHRDRDQFFRVEKGKGELLIDGNKIEIRAIPESLFLPALGTTSRILATSL